MKFKLSSILFGLSLFFALPASVLAFTAGPVGHNNFRAYPGPGKGDMTLEWQRASLNGENYTLLYGTGEGVYEYSAPNVGYIATYTVHNLVPGKRYHFALQPIWIGNNVQPISGVVSAVAPRSAVTVKGLRGPVGRNQLVAKSGPQSGQVTLSWKRFFSDTTGYSIVYGTMPGKYEYGVVDAVKVTSDTQNDFTYTVSSLKSGKRYYFALIPSRSSAQGGIYTTAEVSTLAK